MFSFDALRRRNCIFSNKKYRMFFLFCVKFNFQVKTLTEAILHNHPHGADKVVVINGNLNELTDEIVKSLKQFIGLMRTYNTEFEKNTLQMQTICQQFGLPAFGTE